MAEKILLGNVTGPRGPKGEQGDDYVLTNADKSEIADLVADYSLQRNVPITVNCIHDYSGLPIYVTITLKNSDGNVIDSSDYQAGEYTFMAPPMFNYKLSFDAPGYNAQADITISGLPKTGFTQTIRFVPSAATTFTVDYKFNGEVLQHNVVQPHGSVSYQGDDISESGKVWTGWDDASGIGSVSDVTENMVIQPTFCTPSEPDEIKDMSLYDFIYSDYDSDNSAYTQEEFAWILLNDAAKTYWAVGNRVKMKVQGWGITNDDAFIIQLEAFNHYKLAGSDDFALTTWLSIGVMNVTHRINATNTNLGGWAESEATGWLNNTVYPKVPTFWRNLIKQVSLPGFYPELEAGEIKIKWNSSDAYLWAPSHVDIWGGTAEPYYSEVDADAENKQFPWYATNTKIKKATNGYGLAQAWWPRSPDPSSVSSFRYVDGLGNDYSSGATYASCWALGFCI